MAGIYQDVPGHRFEYHLDGTVLRRFRESNSTWTDISSNMTLMNDEDTDYIDLEPAPGSTATDEHFRLYFIFPELRDIAGYWTYTNFIFSSGAGYSAGDLAWSADTTDGSDGTWTQSLANWVTDSQIKPDYRRDIQVDAVPTGVKALRFRYIRNTDTSPTGQVRCYAMHLYGNITAGENPDRLRFWDPSLDQEAGGAHFDVGDLTQGDVAQKTFRVKNNSSTLTANDITAVAEDVSDSMTTTVEFSWDGTTWASSLAVGTLAPGATSALIYVRRSLPATAGATQRSFRIRAYAASWS